MKTPSQYRAQAREVLQNRWGEAAIMQVVILGLVVILSAPSALATLHPEFAALTNMSSLATLLILPIQYAFYNVLLRALRSENEMMVFKNVFNDWYARDCSKKIKAVFKAKGQSGKPLTTIPPYGYKKSETDKNVWEIDDEAAKGASTDYPRIIPVY